MIGEIKVEEEKGSVLMRIIRLVLTSNFLFLIYNYSCVFRSKFLFEITWLNLLRDLKALDIIFVGVYSVSFISLIGERAIGTIPVLTKSLQRLAACILVGRLFGALGELWVGSIW